MPIPVGKKLQYNGQLMRIVLNEVAISYSRGSSRPRDQTRASLTLAGGFFTTEPLKIFGWPKSLFRFFIAWYGETWMNLLANLIVISICDPSKFLWVRNLREAYLGDCSQTLSWGCTHLKACLGLDDLFPRWLTDNTTGQPVLDVGERSEFLPTRPFHIYMTALGCDLWVPWDWVMHLRK